ncbi:helix-turn-helix domain-containing protein [Kitasatospora sp. NBC_01246]|nr:helix-turn-helix domain-containing protein [Kitasatospora sp. NBC_01246]
MQAAELLEQRIKPPEVARRLRVSPKSAYRWHQLWRDGVCGLCPLAARVGHSAVCRRTAWRNSPRTWTRARPHTAGWRTRCGPRRGWPR